MEQMVKFIPGENGSPGQFVSPLPIEPFNINSVKGNKTTADEQNGQMVLKLQKDPEAQRVAKVYSGRTEEGLQAFHPYNNRL